MSWGVKTINELYSIKGGKRLPKGVMLQTTPNKHPYIRITDMKDGKVLNLVDSFMYVPEAVVSTISSYRVKQSDLILSIVGQIGSINIVGETLDGANLTENCVKLIPLSNTVDSNFVYYYLKSDEGQDKIDQRVVGSTQPKLPIYNIQTLDIPFPPLPEQKAIASVLSSLDDKIDLLHRQNKTLEAMAETLFRQWFIEDESLDEVAVSELVTFNPKRTLAKGTESTYLEMAGLSTQNFNATGYYQREFTSGTKFIHQDTLLARITPCLENGKAGYVTFLSDTEVGWGSTEYIVMRPKSGIHPLMAYVLCRNQDFKDYAESCMEGSSGRQRVNVEHLQEFTIGKPTDEVIQQFNEYLESIETKLIYNSKQIQTLENLRDTLLPKLMSGEVRVQYQTEEVA